MRAEQSSDGRDGNVPLPESRPLHRERHGPDGRSHVRRQDPYPAQGRNPYPPSARDPFPEPGYNPYPPSARDPYPPEGRGPYPQRRRDPYLPLGRDPAWKVYDLDHRRRQSEGVDFLISVARSQGVTSGFPILLPPGETREQRTMQAPPRAEPAAAGPRALGVLRDPALRSAIALALSAILSGALGLVFWAKAAHYQAPVVVGHVSAEVSAISFLAVIGGLNLATAFPRFLPLAGWNTRRVLLASYAASATVGLIASAIFMLTPLSSKLVLDGTAGRWAFTLCVVINSIFMFQDGGLVGFGKAAWVPVENLLVAVARLGLIAFIARSVSHTASVGLLWSWAVPMGIAVLAVNSLSFGPLAGRLAKKRPNLPPTRRLLQWVGIEAATTLVNASVTAFLPALVAWRLGDVQGAYFFVPWTIATMASLLLTNVFISMVREVVAAPERAAVTIGRSIKLVAAVTLAGVVGCTVLAQFVLLLLGHDYAIYGASFLRWIGLSLPATAINLLYVAVCLIKFRPAIIFAANCVITVGTIGGLMLLHPGTSIAMVGVIYCAVTWAVAVACAIPAVRGIRDILRNPEAHSA